MELKDARIAIVGLGLMGGSLALALRGNCASLLGIDTDHKVLKIAQELQVVDIASSEPEDLLQLADVIVLAIPVKAILAFLSHLDRLVPGAAVVFDLGSTKRYILSQMAALPVRFDPVGGHPMCGKESHSLVNATSSLYKGAPFALTPLPRTTSRAKKIAQEIVHIIGAKPIWLNPETHDQWVAETSHLPYLLSNTLAYSTSEHAAELIGPGFRSSARLAVKPRSMMIDILETNRENILPAIELFQQHLNDLKQYLQNEDYASLSFRLSQGADQYEAILAINEEERKL